MSEEKSKGKHIVSRIVSIIALFAGIATFLCVLLQLPLFFIFYFVDGNHPVITDITAFLLVVTIIPVILFWVVAPIGLVLSIVTLFIERNKYFRLLPVAFVMIGVLLYVLLEVLAVTFKPLP